MEPVHYFTPSLANFIAIQMIYNPIIAACWQAPNFQHLGPFQPFNLWYNSVENSLTAQAQLD